MKRLAPFILIAGDVIALLLFVAIGQRDHDIINPIPTIFMVVAMALGGAFVIAWRLLFLVAVWLLQRRTPEAKTA